MELNLDNKIIQLTKERNSLVDVYKELKTNILIKEKESGINPSSQNKLVIINKMIKTRENAIKEFMSQGRDELTDQYNREIKELQSILPKENKEDILNYITSIIEEEYPQVSMKNTKEIVEKVKSKYITVDGQMVSSVIKSKLN